MNSVRKQLRTLKNFCENKKEIYLYGAGEYAIKAKSMLNVLGISPVAAIVSNGMGGINQKSDLDISIIELQKFKPGKSFGIVVALGIKERREVDNDIINYPRTYYTAPHQSMLEITTKIGCNVNCKYCPQETLIEKYCENNEDIYLDYSTFQAVLAKIPVDTLIRFCGMCEPFLNPKTADMIEYASKKGYRVDCYSTLVGLEEKDIDRVLSSVESFVPHVADKDGNAKIDVNSGYLAKLDKVLNYQNERGERLVSFVSVQGILDESVRKLIPSDMRVSYEIMDRAGNIESEGAVATGCVHEAPLSCGFCFNRLDCNVMLPNGDILVCCMDYGLQNVVGNIITDSYLDILDGSKLGEIRKQMIYGNDSICHRCIYSNELLLE